MKILLLHSDFIEFEAKKKAIKNAEEWKKGPVTIKDCLVVFTAVEDRDESVQKETAEKAVEEILRVAKEVKADRIVLYPYVHLTTGPAKPAAARSVLKLMEELLKKKVSEVYHAPFGWYKAFNIKVKGHPLAELSREIFAVPGPGRGKETVAEVPEALKKEETLKSSWYIVEPSGKIHKISLKGGKISGFDFSRHKKLEKLCRYEMAKSRLVKEEPPHIKLMRKLEIADYEPGSDPGNLRYYPKGRLIKSLLELWDIQNTTAYGAMEIESPVMYDYEHPSLKKYLNRFPARQYTIDTPNKRVFLRFAACFGQFLMAHDMGISYRNLPLRMYELTRYSFRVEQRGELAGLRRLRAFTMPDTHAFCKDITQAKEEFIKRFELAEKIHQGTGISKEKDMELSLRIVRSFLNRNKKFVIQVVKKWGRPALMEVWDKRFFYFVFKMEWNFIDALDKAACLTTDQIDVENAERYGIKYTDRNNRRKYPIILHMSPSGGIERVMYALLEKAWMEHQAGKNPTLPLWLSPTQIRLCPVSDAFLKFSKVLADKIKKENIRVDIDDRIESIGKKVRSAEMEWVPYIVVVGEKEKRSGKLAVRFRETSEVKLMKPEELVKHIKNKTQDFPYKPLPLPMLLSERPTFVAKV